MDLISFDCFQHYAQCQNSFRQKVNIIMSATTTTTSTDIFETPDVQIST